VERKNSQKNGYFDFHPYLAASANRCAGTPAAEFCAEEKTQKYVH
jgi:hypothetical protein